MSSVLGEPGERAGAVRPSVWVLSRLALEAERGVRLDVSDLPHAVRQGAGVRDQPARGGREILVDRRRRQLHRLGRVRRGDDRDREIGQNGVAVPNDAKLVVALRDPGDQRDARGVRRAAVARAHEDRVGVLQRKPGALDRHGDLQTPLRDLDQLDRRRRRPVRRHADRIGDGVVAEQRDVEAVVPGGHREPERAVLIRRERVCRGPGGGRSRSPAERRRPSG